MYVEITDKAPHWPGAQPLAKISGDAHDEVAAGKELRAVGHFRHEVGHHLVGLHQVEDRPSGLVLLTSKAQKHLTNPTAEGTGKPGTEA